jgi:DNA-binding transcriptional LysR family regulator
MVELKHLRYLIAVSEETTFIRAAERLHLAQPALSRQIHKFEKEIGAPVFERGRAGVTLTEAGKICLQVARNVMDRVESAANNARMADAGRGGDCRIFVSKWAVWSGFSGRLVGYLSLVEPTIRVTIHEGDISGHWRGLQRRDVDVTIGTQPPATLTDLHSEILIDDIVDIALLGQNHPLARRKSVTLSDLANDTFLIFDDSIVNYEDYDLFALFERSGFNPTRIRRIPSSEPVLALVAAGQGWSLQRRSLRDRIPGFATVPIRNFEFHYPVALLRREDETRSVVFTVMDRIRQLAARDYPDLYHPSATDVKKIRNVRGQSTFEHQLELRALRYFTAVIEDQTIGRAAERLELSQPTLSRQIRSLERDLGVILLERAPRGIVPTAAGESLYRDAHGILDEVARLPAEVERGRRAASRHCAIAATPSSNIRDILSTVLRQAKERHQIDIFVQETLTPVQPAALHDATYDIGLCHPFTNLMAGYPDVDCRLLLNDVLDGALLPFSHPLSKRRTICFTDLEDIPFLFFQREFHPPFYDFVMETFRRQDYRPLIGPMQEGLWTMWALAAEGEGWCLGSASERKNPPAGLIGVKVEGFNIPWGVNLLTRRDESRFTPVTVTNLLLDAARDVNSS